MTADSLYPPAPTGVPADLTRPDSAYRWGMIKMIAGLFAFLLVYLILIALAAWLAHLLFNLPVEETRGRSGRGSGYIILVKFGGGIAALMLCLFLVKGLFKGQRVERSNYLTLQERDHPQLFAFIRRVYQDTGAPAPRRVYASPDVNAALVYDTSLLNLVVPPKKDLLIGLGLVNVVDLAEFKAVLAHEFGHFAQKSVGLGSYLYVANRVMRDIIYSRDALDRFVDRWASIDIRISFPAWGLKGVLWAVRGMLSGIFRGLNLLHLSLSRQMEFNADNVAVSVTGSDALIHALSRLGFAAEALQDAGQSLDAAADHGLFTDDIFLHHTKAAERLRRLRKDDRLGLPPELPEDLKPSVRVFQPETDGVPDRYRSHPTDHMREANAKRFYVRGPRDDRSPWLLFGERAALKEEASREFYRVVLGRKEEYRPTPAEEVQRFVEAEHSETTYDPRYHGWYDDRFVEPGDVSKPPAEPMTPEAVTAWLDAWPPADLEARVKVYRERQSEAALLRGLQSGELTLKGTNFPFRDKQHTIWDVPNLLKKIDAEVESDFESFKKLDRDGFVGHWSLARRLDRDGGARAADLLERYQFHAAIQSLLRGMLSEDARLIAILNYLSDHRQLEAADFAAVQNGLGEIRHSVRNNLEDARKVRTPALTNVPAGSALHDLIVDRGDTALPALDGQNISGDWLMKLKIRLDGVLGRVKRLHFKSLGALLARQEGMAREWAGRSREEPAAESESAT